jgi:hypothetical protein
VGGENVLDALENLPVKPGTERPAKVVKITEVVMYVTTCGLPAPNPVSSSTLTVIKTLLRNTRHASVESLQGKPR